MVYPCFCSRKQIRIEVDQAGRAPHGPSGEALYPGICRDLDPAEGAWRIKNGEPYALRLDVGKALARTGPLFWDDVRAGLIPADPLSLGDVVLARKDVPTSYHLAVTVDDHLQGVTLITRGEDLFHATHIHRLLQALLGPAHAALLPSQPDRRQQRPAAGQAQPRDHPAPPARLPPHAGRCLAHDRAGRGSQRQGVLIA